MTSIAKLTKLLDEVPAPAKSEVVRALNQVAHDVNTPISTIATEVYSVRLLLRKVPAETRERLRSEGGLALAALEDICDNLEHASAALRQYIEALGALDAVDDAD